MHPAFALKAIIENMNTAIKNFTGTPLFIIRSSFIAAKALNSKIGKGVCKMRLSVHNAICEELTGSGGRSEMGSNFLTC
jgi:hypothetical protein